MVESAAYIHLMNIPSDWSRKNIYELFSPFGPIKKLYLSPQLDFGKIYLDSSESCVNAYQGIKKNKYNLKVTIFLPPSSSGISNFDENCSNDGSDTMINSHRPKKYASHDNVNTSVTRGYVDVFGRVVTTLQDDEGDIYVSLTELKKSGFELFQLGSLPTRNSSHVYDEQKMAQFELYLKMKATKFMSTHNFDVTNVKVNSIIENEKSDFFCIGAHVGANSTMRQSIGNSKRDRYDTKGFQPPINYKQQKNNENFNCYSDRSSTTSGENKIVSLMDIQLDNQNHIKNNILKNKNQYDKNRTQGTTRIVGSRLADHNTTETHVNQGTARTIRSRLSDRNTTEIHVNNVEPEKEIHLDIKPIVRVPLLLNQSQQVTVVHVESAHVGWVQLSTNISVVEAILVDTLEECQYAPPVTPTVNLICGALFMNIWFRSIVLSTSPLKVQYIDYGNQNTEDLGEIRKLSNKLSTIPAQAICISIEGDEKVQLSQDTDLIITPLSQRENGMYVVEITEPSASENNSTGILASSKVEPFTLPKLRKPHSVSKLIQSIPEPQKKVDRKVIIEEIFDKGELELISMTGARTFTAFAFNNRFTPELKMLEEITKDCKRDPTYQPIVGDIVAACNNVDFVRGLILNESNGQYTCALIDYGTINIVNEVRPLPEKYVLIPEFAFECEADPSIIEELKAAKQVSLQIKTPLMLTITFKSGKTYDLHGHCWNPLEPSSVFENLVQKSQSNEIEKSTVCDKKLSQNNENNVQKFQNNEILEKSTVCDKKLSQNNENNIQKLQNNEILEKSTVCDKTLAQSTTFERKTVVEDISDNGIFNFVKLIDEKSFIAFVCPDTFTQEITLLEDICEDTVLNPSFKPDCGEIVAALGSEGFARGVVLNIAPNGNYECALIDFGTIEIVQEVRKLPDKYKNIPEFAIVCTADNKIVKDIQDTKCESVKISSPFVLTVKLDSGKQYDIKAVPWVPFKPKLEGADSKLSQEVILSPSFTHLKQSKSDKDLNICEKKLVVSQRKLTIEDCCERGIFDFVKTTSDTSFTCFVCPDTFGNEVAALDDIYKDSYTDKSFTPKKGDLVAACTSEGVKRGLVMNIANGKFQCALIDYGTIESVSEVRSLPDKYVNIPEFACECRADARTVQELQNSNCIPLQIKSPYTLTITLESGKEHVIKGFQWDPLTAQSSVKPQSNPNSESNNVQSKTNQQPQTLSSNPQLVSNTPNSTKQQPQTTNSHSILSSNVQNKPDEHQQITRKLVIDEICDSGVFEFAELIDEKTFVGFALPSIFTNQLDELEKINDDCQPDPSFKPNVSDLVAAPGPEGYVRAIIIDIVNQHYICILIDYGLTKKVDNVRPLPDKYKGIPEFAFECSADSNIVEDLKQIPCKSLQITSPCTLSLLLETGKEYVVKGYRWNPLATQHSAPVKEKVKQPVLYKCPAQSTLTDGDQVIIVGTRENILLVRNKECNSLFKFICNELGSYKGRPFEDIPQEGCLAVCNFKDNNLYRVVINKIQGANATIEYIDYGDIGTVSINELKTISEKLALMKNTLIKIQLKEFVINTFSDDMLKSLMENSEKKEKFVAHKVPGETNIYELIGSNQISLSEKLKNYQKNNLTISSKSGRTTPNIPIEEKHKHTINQVTLNKKEERTVLNDPYGVKLKSVSSPRMPGKHVCRFHDIVIHDMKVGSNKLMCLHTGFLNEGNVSFCKADDETMQLLQHLGETIPNYVKNDNEPYIPGLFEVCLVKFQGEWCRAAIVSIKDVNTYGAFYVDYGNSQDVEPSEIKKLPQELSKIRALAIICKLEGVLQENEETVKEDLLARLMQDIIENEVYSVNFLSTDNNHYSIVIPSLLDAWKKDGLL